MTMGARMRVSRISGAVGGLVVGLVLALVGTGVAVARPVAAPADPRDAHVLDHELPGPEVLRTEGDAVPEIAARTRMSTAQVERILADETSHVSPDGGIFFAEPPD